MKTVILSAPGCIRPCWGRWISSLNYRLEFYRAHRAFLAITTSTEMQFKFRLNKGDCQVFDNARIMHARSAFDPNSGYRHLQGCYICRDDLQSRLEVLRRKGRDHRQT